MAIGMSYDEYWYGDPHLIQVYYEANTYKRRQKNQELWLQGLYVAHAVSSVLSKNKYPKEPLDIYPKTKKEKEAEASANREKIIDFFTAFQKSWERKNGNNR